MAHIFLKLIITGGKTWIYRHDLEIKIQSSHNGSLQIHLVQKSDVACSFEIRI